jgi:hypothetical protein
MIRVVHPGSGSPIRILIVHPIRIPDPLHCIRDPETVPYRTVAYLHGTFLTPVMACYPGGGGGLGAAVPGVPALWGRPALVCAVPSAAARGCRPPALQTGRRRRTRGPSQGHRPQRSQA